MKGVSWRSDNLIQLISALQSTRLRECLGCQVLFLKNGERVDVKVSFVPALIDT